MDIKGIAADRPIAVIGAGTMGSGIAQIAAQAGHHVTVIDANADALDRGRTEMAKGLARLVDRGKITAEQKAAIEAQISWTVELTAASDAALAIEAIVENVEAKASLFAKLSDILADDAVIASNTSSLSVNVLAEAVDRSEFFLGLHFFNPVPVMKLVELVPGQRTRQDVVASMLATVERWGKVVVRVRDVPGFIVNRVARPYYAEAFALLGDGTAPEAIDGALESAGGFRMGPLALTDLIGQEINFSVAVHMYDIYNGKTRFRPQEAQRMLAENGKFGRKSGEGVYRYPEGRPEPDFTEAGVLPGDIAVANDAGALTDIVAALKQAGVSFLRDEGTGKDSLLPETLRIGDISLACGDGRPLAARPEVDVLIDHIRDFGRASAVVITARSDKAASVAAALFDRLGKRAISLPDRPGQLVLRTLAQLANAAADAVIDEVASEEDIDRAMRFGANHPEGPLEWARRFGIGRLADVLTNISKAEGDDLYVPSAFF